MTLDLTAILYFAYIIAIGIAFAIIYTNIQRSAYAKFIDALMTNEAFSQDDAKTLKELGIKGIKGLFIKSSIKSKHGLGKCICVVSDKSQNDALEAFLAGKNNSTRYYIQDDDHDAILNKYNYKSIKFIHMIGYLLALIIAMIVFTCGIRMFFDKYVTPKLESRQEEKIEEQIDSFNNDSDIDEAEQIESEMPRVPTLN